MKDAILIALMAVVALCSWATLVLAILEGRG